MGDRYENSFRSRTEHALINDRQVMRLDSVEIVSTIHHERMSRDSRDRGYEQHHNRRTVTDRVAFVQTPIWLMNLVADPESVDHQRPRHGLHHHSTALVTRATTTVAIAEHHRTGGRPQEPPEGE